MEYRKLVITAIIPLTILFSFMAKADRILDAEKSLDSQAQEVISVCNSTQCQKPFALETFTEGKLSALPESELQAYLDIARAQAEIWGDTIYEGPFASNGSVVLERVNKYFENGRLLFFTVTYYESALYTENAGCRFDQLTSTFDSLTCVNGRITETSTVSSDLKTIIIRAGDEAHFN